MSNHINCVVDTHSKQERERLIDYVSEKELFVSIIDDFDGFQLVGITYSGDVGYLGVIAANDLVKNQGYKHFSSIDEYIAFREAK